MKYETGEDIEPGDFVLESGCYPAVVVAVIASDKVSERYPAGMWSYLETGILIESESTGFVHLPDADRLRSIRRG